MSFVNNTNWRGAMASLASTIDETFGETLIITPVERKPNYEGTADESNAYAVQGVFTAKPELALAEPHGHKVHHGGGSGLVETRVPIFSFARAQMRWPLRRGDRITRCCDGSQFEITRIENDATSARVVVHVVQLGRMEP